MTDIVERLREWQNDDGLIEGLMTGAADEIERLREALRHYACDCKDEFSHCKARYDSLVCCGWAARSALQQKEIK